jgi:hypothetical protein
VSTYIVHGIDDFISPTVLSPFLCEAESKKRTLTLSVAYVKFCFLLTRHFFTALLSSSSTHQNSLTTTKVSTPSTHLSSFISPAIHPNLSTDMSSLDQSLDGILTLSPIPLTILDIISAKPRNRGIRKGRRGLRVNKALANAATRQTTTKTPATTGKAATTAAAPAVDATSVFDQGSKIIVSNLVNPRKTHV